MSAGATPLQASPLDSHLQELLGAYYGPRSRVVIKIGPKILLGVVEVYLAPIG